MAGMGWRADRPLSDDFAGKAALNLVTGFGGNAPSSRSLPLELGNPPKRSIQALQFYPSGGTAQLGQR